MLTYTSVCTASWPVSLVPCCHCKAPHQGRLTAQARVGTDTCLHFSTDSVLLQRPIKAHHVSRLPSERLIYSAAPVSPSRRTQIVLASIRLFAAVLLTTLKRRGCSILRYMTTVVHLVCFPRVLRAALYVCTNVVPP